MSSLFSAKCRALKHSWEGHVYEERHPHDNKKVWVARLQCSDCSTEKIEFMKPRTCELISRRYLHSEGYDTTMEHSEARKLLFTAMRAS